MVTEETLQLLRKYNVLKYVETTGEVVFFAPQVAEAPVAVEPEPVAEPQKEVKVGKDGLTEEQQVELFGRVMG